MSYEVSILRTAQRQLAKLDYQARTRLERAIRSLGSDPRPPGSRKLSGRPAWRVRVGSYRIIYEIHDQDLVVLVVNVGDRKNIYK